MSTPSLHARVLAYADLLARSSGELPAVDVAWRLRVIAGVLCSYGDGCQSPPWPGYTMCERHVSQSALEDSWAPSSAASTKESP